MIQKMSSLVPFDFRPSYILPLVQKVFDSQAEEAGLYSLTSSSKVRVKALQVILSLFDELIDCSDEVFIEAFDFKLFPNYILPVIKRLMD